MELNGYRLLLPEGTLDYFDLVDVKESVNEVVIYLEEKNIVPEKYTDQDTESKGFYDPVIVQDFPLRGKKVFLNIRRRRWILKKNNEYISRNWRMVAEGTRMTQDFASFFILSGFTSTRTASELCGIRFKDNKTVGISRYLIAIPSKPATR